MKKFAMMACVAAAALSMQVAARAADLPVKAPVASPYFSYPTANGWFWGVSASGLGGTTSSTNGLASGNLIGGKVGLDVGYTGNIGQGFWFVEQNFNAQAIQGAGANLQLSATFGMEQRYAIGASQDVVGKVVNLIPGLSSISMPSIPLINNVTWTPPNWYVFGATYQDDVSATLGTATGRSWLFSYGAGVGALYRGSNGWVFDTSVEWKHEAAGLLVGNAPIGSVTPFADAFIATGRLKF